MAEQSQNIPIMHNLQNSELNEITRISTHRDYSSVNSSANFDDNPLRDDMLLNSSDNVLRSENNNFGGGVIERSAPTASNNNDAKLRDSSKIDLRSIEQPSTSRNNQIVQQLGNAVPEQLEITSTETLKPCNLDHKALNDSLRVGLIEPPVTEPNTSIANPRDIFQEQYEKMESEFMCSICSNLFIEAVTLNCSHTFCSFCIRTWQNEKSHCPICRTGISTTTRTLVLDNVLDKMAQLLSAEDREQRKAIVEERQKAEKTTALPTCFVSIDNIDSGLTTDSEVETELEIEENSDLNESEEEYGETVWANWPIDDTDEVQDDYVYSEDEFGDNWSDDY